MPSKGRGAAANKRKKDVLAPPQLPSSSSAAAASSSVCPPSSKQRGVRVASKRRNPRILTGSSWGRESDADALALPLGMSIAAVMAQVLEKKESPEEQMSADHLSALCTLAVRESLTNVFGDKFDCFMRNFEKSFQSTLRTIRLINDSSQNRGPSHLCHLNAQQCNSDLSSPVSRCEGAFANNSIINNSQPEEVHLPADETEDQLNFVEEVGENMQTDSMNLELARHQRRDQLSASVSSSMLGPLGSMVNQSLVSTYEKSVIEQTRYNNLKAYEIGLQMKKLQLKETELALHSHSNLLERFKLSLGISKASFRAEKFKTQLEETRHGELLRNCIDCLVAGLLIMSAALGYGAYIHSYKRITEATASCKYSEEPLTSWWIPKPVSSFKSGLHIIRCQLQVITRMLFGFLMILAVCYLLLQRSSAMKQTMPVTYILLLLGLACGIAGKLCVETLGGDGFHWLFYWEALCLLHFLSNVWTSALFVILHGPITVSEGAKSSSVFPHWLRRYLFYAITLLFLPLLCGLMPFAGPGEWKDHFSLLIADFLPFSMIN